MSKPQRTPSLEFTHATEDMAAVRVGLSVSFPDIRPPDRKYAHSGTQTLWDVESPHEEGVRPDGRSKLPETPSPTSSVVEKTATMVSDSIAPAEDERPPLRRQRCFLLNEYDKDLSRQRAQAKLIASRSVDSPKVRFMSKFKVVSTNSKSSSCGPYQSLPVSWPVSRVPVEDSATNLSPPGNEKVRTHSAHPPLKVTDLTEPGGEPLSLPVTYSMEQAFGMSWGDDDYRYDSWMKDTDPWTDDIMDDDDEEENRISVSSGKFHRSRTLADQIDTKRPSSTNDQMVTKDASVSPTQRRRAFSLRQRKRKIAISPSRSDDNVIDLPGDETSETRSRKSMPKYSGMLQFHTRHLAEELALIDSDQLRSVHCMEFVKCGWMKKEKDQLAPNIIRMVHDFNRLALTVSSEILEYSSPQERADAIMFYIKLAVQCLTINNFNSVQAILGGLQCAAIHRLSMSWKEVSVKRKKQYKKLTLLMSDAENFCSYRKALESALENHRPCVPFLGVFLSTVVQVDAYESQRSKQQLESPASPHAPVKASRHNFVPLDSSLASVRTEFYKYQLASVYSFASREPIRKYLLNVPYKTEEESYKLSVILEPQHRASS